MKKTAVLLSALVATLVPAAPAQAEEEAPSPYCATTEEVLQLRAGMSRKEVKTIVFDGGDRVLITQTGPGLILEFPRCSEPEVADRLLRVQYQRSYGSTSGYWRLYAWA